MQEAYNDVFWWSPFQDWAQATYGYKYANEWQLFSAIDKFRGDPSAANGDEFLDYFNRGTGVSFEIPSNLIAQTRQGLAHAPNADPNPLALDALELHTIAQTQPVWDYFVSLNPNPSRAGTDAYNTIDWGGVYARNHSNTNEAADGAELDWVQWGDALLIGTGHTPNATAYLDNSTEAVWGKLTVEKSRLPLYPNGRLRVVGCVEQDEFKKAVEKSGSAKHVSFRDQ